MKTLFKGLSIVGAFVGIWLLLSQINFVGFLKIDKMANKTETSIGDAIWDDIKTTEKIIVNDSISKTIDKLLKPICDENEIERDSLKIHIIQNSEVNAFALPNGHLVVYAGLINEAKNEQALIGVLGHEIAHIEKNHVMKKLSKEIGLSVILSMTTGGKDPGVLKQIMQSLSSSAYDRSLEEEADIASVEYMTNSKINPAPFADFLYEMSFTSEVPSQLSWLSTHPESEERAKYILEYIKGKKFDKKTILSESDWKNFKERVSGFE